MEKNKKEQKQYKGSAKFQIALLIIFGIIASWMLYRPTQGFNTDDEYPDIIPLTPQKIINLGGSPSEIDVGIYIRDIPKFSIVRGAFLIDLTVWFRFNPGFVSLEKISLFSFESAKVKYKSKPFTKIENGHLVAYYDMRLEFSMSLDYQYFPFDDHKISFALTNNAIPPSEAMFKSSKSNLIVNKEIKLPGWKLVNKHIKTGYIVDIFEPHKPQKTHTRPRVIFSLDLARSGVRHVVTILLPLLLIFLISLFTLSFSPYGHNAGNIISISIATVTAVIAHRFVIESMSPKSGTFMISDYLFVLFLIGCSIVFIMNIFTKKIKGFYKNIIALLLNIFVLSAIAYILYPLF